MDLFAFLSGIILGVIAGFLPGIHPNTLSSILSTTPLSDEFLSFMIIGMFPANLIASFVPAIFFGIPEAGTFITALPGQRMTMEGRGLTAFRTVMISILIAILFASALFYPSLFLFPFVYCSIQSYLKYIVLALSLILIFKSGRKLLALLVFVTAGILGHFSLNSGVYDPFMPLFSGMFAVGMLLNIKEGSIPEQKKEEPFSRKLIPYILLSVLVGMFADILPGISSPSQMAVFMSLAVPMNSLAYISSVSSISISEAIFSLSTNMSIGKSRIGTTVWLSKFTDIGSNIYLLLSMFIFSAAITAVFLYKIRKKITVVATVNSRTIATVLIIYLFVVAALLDGFLGILIFLVSSALGWVTVRLGVERTQLMGAVIIPTLMILFDIFI
jgi:putative membrane protein